MIIAFIIIILLTYVTSTNQNHLTVIHNFEHTMLNNLHLDSVVTEAKTNHKDKRSKGAFDEFAAYSKFANPGENFVLYDELWKNIAHKDEEPHSYLYVCGDDDITDISCYNDLENDGLKDADGDEMTFPEKNIFFVEASCQMGLSFHQVCSIESAARANPEWQVSVLFAGRIPKQCQRTINFTTLETYGNIHIYRIHVKKFADGTPFQDFFNSNALDNSLYPVYHSAEILQYLTLHKWGGVYLDTNMMVSKPFDNLPLNWIARENADELGTAAMALTKDNIGGLISKAAVEILAKTFCVSKYCANGFGAITQALNETCEINDVSRQWKSHSCPGLRILESKYFYPLEYFIEHQYTDQNFKLSDAHTYHIWSKSIPEESLPFYRKLAKAYCPRAYTFLAYGFNESLYFDSVNSKTRRPQMLVTESLAEPLLENVRPQKPTLLKNKPVAVSYQTLPPCRSKNNGTSCSHAKKGLVKKKTSKKSKKNKMSKKEIKNRRFKAKLLKDARKLKFIKKHSRKRMPKPKSTNTATEQAIIVKIVI